MIFTVFEQIRSLTRLATTLTFELLEYQVAQAKLLTDRFVKPGLEANSVITRALFVPATAEPAPQAATSRIEFAAQAAVTEIGDAARFPSSMNGRVNGRGATGVDPHEPLPHDRIAERAYALWELESRPDGRQLDHWLRAERELTTATRANALESVLKDAA